MSDLLFSIAVMVGAVQTYKKELMNYNDYLFCFTFIGSTGYYSVAGLNLDRAYALTYPYKASMRTRNTYIKEWSILIEN